MNENGKMWKWMGKKVLAWGVLAGIMAGGLCGCQKTGDNSGAGSSGGTVGSEEVMVGKENEETGALGRFRETEMELPPETAGKSLLRFAKGQDGVLEMFMVKREDSGKVLEGCCYRYRDGSWSREEWPGYAQAEERGIDLELVTYGMDGYYYMGGTDEDYRFHLLKLDEDGMAQELLEEVFLPGEGRTYGLIPTKVEVLSNGNLLVYAYSEVYLYTPLGERLLVLAKDFSGNTSDARGFCDGESLITVYGKNMVVYRLEDGKVTETAAMDEIAGEREEMELFGDSGGGIFAAGEMGLAHINRGGTLWEILIDGSLNHMGMRSMVMRAFFGGDEGDYYGVFSDSGSRELHLFHYVFDPDMEAVPPNTLTVYSLKDWSTVRQAASQFQSEHPEVKVELRTAAENGGSVSEEMIQSLNTELLSGNGADVLILDGLPAEAYVEKGVLMDMRGLVEDMEASGVLLNNLIDGFRQEDGAVYRVPARIGVPLLLGESDAVNAYESLEAMAGYAGDKPLCSAENYENLLRQVARLQYKELFAQDQVLDRDKMIQYLETVKTVGEAGGSKTVFTSEAEMEEKWVSNNVVVHGIVGSAMNYDRGMCDSGVECIDGFGDLAIPAQVRVQRPGMLMVPAGRVFLPSMMAGINQSTENEELAEEFVRCLLSKEVQKEELYDGLPVNREALQVLTEREKGGYMVSAGYGDYFIDAEWPALEVRRELAEMMETLTVPALVDETVMKMIVEGSVEYFDGKVSAEQAADEILRKLSVYLAE